WDVELGPHVSVNAIVRSGRSGGRVGTSSGWWRHWVMGGREPGADFVRARRVAACDTVGVGVASGTVAFLFTDVEGSRRLWESVPSAMGRAMGRHDELVRSTVEARGGYVFSTGGDSFAVAFARAGDAVAAAVETQLALVGEKWPAEAAIGVRMGLH